VVKGDTLYSISKRYNLTIEELQRLNDLKGIEIKIGQELYVSPD
jgi:LysM repeat protein